MKVLVVPPEELRYYFYVIDNYDIDEVYEAEELEPGQRYFIDTDGMDYAGGDDDNEYVDIDLGKLVWRRLT
jgi:hypothetical protein